MVTPSQVVSFPGFVRGLDNRRHETEALLPTEETLTSLRVANNVDITQTGNIKRRKGYTKLLLGYAHSLYAHVDFPFLVGVLEGALTVYDSAFNVVSSVPIDRYAPVSYTAPIAGAVYWSNGLESGKIDFYGQHQRWGLPKAPSVLWSVSTGGFFPPGKYLLSQRFVSHSGEVGAASDYVEVDLSSSSFISVTTPSILDSSISHVEVFCSTTNGSIAYKIAALPLNTSAPVYYPNLDTGIPLDTLNLSPAVPGSLVCAYRGRIYVASGNILYATKPLHYGLVDFSKDILVFPSSVTLLAAVLDGLYVACDAEGVAFLQGPDILSFDKRIVELTPVVPKAVALVSGVHFELADTDYVVWWSKKGYICLGAPGGEVKYLTYDRLIAPSYREGCVGLVEHDGLTQIISILRDPGPPSSFIVDDRPVDRSCLY